MKTQENEFLTLTHYKEPLTRLKKEEGFGYLGAVSVTLDGTRLQCHVCGELYQDLQWHISYKHKLSNHEYKERFGLAYSTVLISESMRIARKERMRLYYASLTQEQKDTMKRKGIAELKKWRAKYNVKGRFQPKIQLETKNKRGTCPDQLLEKIKEVKNHIGHTPSKREFIDYWESQRYVHLIYTTFGSWTNAVVRAGLLPSEKRPTGTGKRYTPEELIDMLQLYHQENARIPTVSDCNRGLLPPYCTFQRHFGTMVKAREAAGIYEEVGRWKNRKGKGVDPLLTT